MAYTKIAKWMLTGLVVAVSIWLGWLFMSGYRVSVVQTGSMTPAIPRGSLVIAEPVKALRSGDVGLYVNDLGQTIIHRVSYISSTGDYVFKGDANTLVDAAVNKRQVVGAPVWTVPQLGFAALFMKSWTGIVLFIYIPAVLLMAHEINKLALCLSAAQDKSFRRSEQSFKS